MKFDPELERRLTRADKAVETLKPRLGEAVREELTKVFDETLAELAGAAGDSEAALNRLRTLARELKGNAGTYGYEIASVVADSLHAYLETIEEPDDLAIQLIRDHRNSIEVSMSEEISAEDQKHLDEFIALSRELVKRAAG
ncbi:MAG: hypothetical protein QF654_09515 [Alphaproteobacteria bacterium]|jgi:hypothetical protein|nr:hypothetical protein [Alphaproteobacteria bacterium]